MLSYASSFFNYLLSRDEDEEEEDQSFEAKLAELQVEDVIKNNNLDWDDEPEVREIASSKSCFRKTGVISYIDTQSDYVLIDGAHYFNTSSCSLTLNLNDKVLYMGYYRDDSKIVVVRILENEGNFWGDEDAHEEALFEQTNHTLIGQVHRRDGRDLYMSNGDIKFNLDNVVGTFIPIEGDVLEMSCKVISNEGSDNPVVVSSNEVLEVVAFRPLGLKISPGSITDWNGGDGLCDRRIYFDRQCLPSGLEPRIGTKVMMKIIESYQRNCIYRAIQLHLSDDNAVQIVDVGEDESTLQLEIDQQLDITNPVSFDAELDQKPQITLKITNNSHQIHILNKWMMIGKKRDSQIYVTPMLHQPNKLYPGQTYSLTVICQPKFMGKSRELLLLMFRGFKVKRLININVVGKYQELTTSGVHIERKTEQERYSRMREIKKNGQEIVYGRRAIRCANFVKVRIGQYNVPDRMWNTVLGDSAQIVQTVDYRKIIARIDDKYPFLTKELSVYNYSDKWHTLLYMEEMQETINMRSYDIEKTYLVRYREYLSLEIAGLAEKRPSLVVGDKVTVKDVWDEKAPKYESPIHEIRGNCVLMKFSQSFHDNYSGSDVSVEFHFNRVKYRRAHHAVNTAITNLGPELLFPRRLTTRPHQVPPENLESIEWFNTKLNAGQKKAVVNILLGECRPMPYCIYGPPGTGKTVTVVETILQILVNIPHSRILVAAPSNSAANLITERLLDHKNKNPHSMVRVIAHHLFRSGNIPPKIKSYCVTVDVATEGTSMPKHELQDGVNLNCQSSFIGRHRVTIGTCNTLGVLAQMGFPKGHFTHVIVDEAGQATEPEVMIPLTLTDKDNGQIVLAGDPMQLGPILMSRFSLEYCMDESFLLRLLETFPYQKDFTAFESGFNEKLVTRLNDNYRSLKEVLSLPSQMFYDGSLVERLNRNQPWIERLLDITAELFETGDSKSGGIFVHGIRGYNTRAEDSPSWYNPQEATMVALTASKIFKRNVSADDVGIITPYIAQIKYLRSLFEGMGLPLPKIGTVEEFQGQEKPLIIISTVRSTEKLVHEDLKNTLGFVKNPKRLNVALTRAQVAVILFCDPYLLCTDPMWSQVIQQAVKEDKYMGCDLPKISN